MIKRGFDYGFALAGLLALAPLFLFIILWILVADGRPVLFRQTRVGRFGRTFTLLKFRTMTPARGVEDGAFEPGNFRRVTRAGRRLRAAKLDELPQLLNVLKGDMSFVGPRPEVPRWVALHPERWEIVLRVRPGITDPASLAYRNEEKLLAGSSDPERFYREEILPRKLDLYEKYVRERGFWKDLGIMVRTVLAVIT